MIGEGTLLPLSQKGSAGSADTISFRVAGSNNQYIQSHQANIFKIKEIKAEYKIWYVVEFKSNKNYKKRQKI